MGIVMYMGRVTIATRHVVVCVVLTNNKQAGIVFKPGDPEAHT